MSSDKVERHLEWANTVVQKGGVGSVITRYDIIPNSGLNFALVSDTDQILASSYEAVFDNKIQSGIVIIDPTQKIRYVNFADEHVSQR